VQLFLDFPVFFSKPLQKSDLLEPVVIGKKYGKENIVKIVENMSDA